MTIALPIDPEVFAAPVPGDEPSGPSLRGEVYDRLKEFAREDSQDEPRGEWTRELKRAEWGSVVGLAEEVLEKRSKDLWVAAWMLEALIARHGLPGAVAGIEVMRVLCENFWDDLHPRMEEGDIEFRHAVFSWVNDHIPRRLNMVPFTAPSTDGLPVCSLSDVERAMRLEQIANKDRGAAEEAVKEGQITLTLVRRSLDATPLPYLAERKTEVEAALAALTVLGDRLMEKSGSGAGLSSVGETLNDLNDLLGSALRERGGLPDMTEEEQGPVEPGVAGEETMETEPSGAGPITSRIEAYRRLEEVARYLERTEPHSPVHLLLRRAITWGHMGLGDVLAELVRDPADLMQIFQVLGMSHDRKQEQFEE